MPQQPELDQVVKQMRALWDAHQLRLLMERRTYEAQVAAALARIRETPPHTSDTHDTMGQEPK